MPECWTSMAWLIYKQYCLILVQRRVKSYKCNAITWLLSLSFDAFNDAVQTPPGLAGATYELFSYSVDVWISGYPIHLLGDTIS